MSLPWSPAYLTASCAIGHGIDLPHLEDRDIELLADDLQLRDGGGTVHVARGEQRTAALLTEIACELGDVRRLTGAL